MSIRRRFKSDDTELDTGPLNDILFILMFFFLIISTMANPNVIKMNNPRATSEAKAKQSVIVSIDKNKDISPRHTRRFKTRPLERNGTWSRFGVSRTIAATHPQRQNKRGLFSIGYFPVCIRTKPRCVP